ncbi:hypothetical protein PILCRDRAFT_68009 [Piloderma croceum F 1598]|uniref:Uncharacterized protein n=1 Tax=Piloderma croceum (strain F 1598) TaxID=765440 RepID=A0A0C3FIL8_PILCF|nr:hypothetical protein PILCRDRAFT_68009 [Piloderma croceum F 1598]
MAYSPQNDVVSGEEYRYALTNFRIAHEKVEQQRQQLEEQERQVALLRERIGLLEGGDLSQRNHSKQGGSSVDDFSIKNAASKLERLINRWAADIIRTPPVPLKEIYYALLIDLVGGYEPIAVEPHPMQVQNLLRHAMSETISEAVVNCLMVTNSSEANIQLTRIHEQIFARDPTVACVWRRQTFSAAVETCSPEMLENILMEHLPSLKKVMSPTGAITPAAGSQVLESANDFSRMLHSSNTSSGGTVDAFYRAFVPELGSTLYPRQIELVKRCLLSEQGDMDRVGATIFPGLVKVTRGPPTFGNQGSERIQTVVRRAQVICECALASASAASNGLHT